MKDVGIDASIRSDERLLAEVEHVTRFLEQDIGPKARGVRAEWTLSRPDPSGERKLQLEISDDSDRASAVFSEREISRMTRSGPGSSLIRLWGDLLQDRSHKQIEKLMRMAEALEKE